jgi:hypothetical protein
MNGREDTPAAGVGLALGASNAFAHFSVHSKTMA